MALSSLLVCADAEAFQVLSRILEDLGIAVEPCGDATQAKTRLQRQHFDAVLLDCQDEPAALQLLAEARHSALNSDTVAIAIVDARNQVREILASGANFILYKPISHERVLHSIRAARGLMRNERRSQPRIPLEAPATISYAAEENVAVHLLDMNDGGMAFRADRKLPPCCKVYFQFSLPGNTSLVRLAGEVMWQDASGRAGIRFAHVPQASLRILQSWLQKAGAERAASRASHPAQSPEPVAESAASRLSAGLGLLSVSAADRRNRSRHACCIGAEVYKTDSNVPNRCSLSDISTGGCYVETTEPFPVGTVLEVVVRMPELKARIFGKVQSVHPGFGMGLQFTLKTEEQQGQIRRLISLAQTPPKLTR
jgi:CheY-like chemotaxis protein